MMAGFVLDIFVEWIFRVVLRLVRSLKSVDWPTYQAKVTGALCLKPGFGCDKAQINYMYKVDGETYTGTNLKPFVSSRSARSYAAQFPKGKQVNIRVSPENPAASVLHDAENDVVRVTW